MEGKKPKGIGACRLSVPAIAKVYIFIYEQIKDYRYTGDNLDVITNYSILELPYEYSVNEKASRYDGEKKSLLYSMYEHSLKLHFPRMEEAIRAELMSLEALELTLIFEDKNGKAWVMGQHAPASLEAVVVKSGTEGEANEYEVVFRSTEKQHVRAILPPSGNCFSSFFVQEFVNSQIIVKNASSLNWQNLKGSSGETVIRQSFSPPLDPTSWSGGLNLTNGALDLFNFFNSANGNVSALQARYYNTSPRIDQVIIDIQSSDTGFGGLIIGATPTEPSSIFSQIYIKSVLSPSINTPSTIIQASDESGVVFSGSVGEDISDGQHIAGTADEATILGSLKYPQGQDISVEILGSECPPKQYQFSYENTLQPCQTTQDFSFQLGDLVSFRVDTSSQGEPLFRDISINIMGYIYNMYQDYTNWHSETAAFQLDLISAIGETEAPVDLDSLEVSQGEGFVEVLFRYTGTSESTAERFVNPVSQGESTALKSWSQSRALRIQTGAPVGATITHEDSLGNVVSGENLVDVNSSSFELVTTTSTANLSIDDIAVLVAFDSNLNAYAPSDTITTRSQSTYCLTPDEQANIPSSYGGYTSQQSGQITALRLDVNSGEVSIGRQLEIVFSDGETETTSLIGKAEGFSGIHHICNFINSIEGVQVVSANLSPLDFFYNIYVYSEGRSIEAISDLDSGRSFTKSTEGTYTNKMSETSPLVASTWLVPSSVGEIAVNSESLSDGFYFEELQTKDAASFTWNPIQDTFKMERLGEGEVGQGFLGSEIRIEVHENNPSSGLEVALHVFVLSGGETSSELTSVSSELDTAKVKYISYINSFNQMQVQSIQQPEGDVNSVVVFKEESQRKPIIWGTADELVYVGSQPSSEPQIESEGYSLYF